MKSLFRFSLCAFAALTLANCTNDITEEGAQAPVERFSMTINAGSPDSDDSRTEIVVVDGQYKMKWHKEGETLTIAEVVDGSIPATNTCEATQITEDNRGSEIFAVFTTSFAGTSDVNKPYTYVACYPHSNANAFNPTEKKVTTTMPAVQTPVKDSADPNATLLFAQHKEESMGRPYQINLKFAHAAAYAKMSLKNVALYKEGDELSEGSVFEKMPKNEIISQIVITNNDKEHPLAGTYTFNYKPYSDNDASVVLSPAVTDKKSQTITLNVEKLGITAADFANGSDVSLFFATAPVTLKDFTVKLVTDDGRTFEKNIKTAESKSGKDIEIALGAVKAFAVNFEGVEAEEKTYARVYNKIYNPYLIGAREFILVTIPSSINTFYNNDNEDNNVTKSFDILNDVNFDVDDKSSPNSIYYIGEESDYGKAVDFTWTFEDAKLDTWSGVGSAGIKSANSAYAADAEQEEATKKAMYLSISSSTPVLSDTKAVWDISSESPKDGTFKLTFSNLKLDLSDTGLKAASTAFVKSQYFYFFADAGLKFVKFENKATEAPEEDVTYKKVTTKALPTSLTKDLDNAEWADLIMTVTKGTGTDAKTYLVKNVNSEGGLSGTPMLEPISDDMLSTKDGATYITVKPKKYTWLTVMYSASSGDGYVFNSASKVAANTYLYVNNGYPELYTSNTQYSATRTDNGNYTLQRVSTYSTKYYLSVDDNGNFIATTNQPTDVYFQFYGKKEIVEKQEDDENKGPVFNIVTTMENGKTYIISSGSYALSNDGSSKTSLSTVLTADGYKSCTFIVSIINDKHYFQSTKNNDWLTGNSIYVGFNTSYSDNYYWTFDTANQKLFYQGIANAYIYPGLLGWNANGYSTTGNTKLTIYEVVE